MQFLSLAMLGLSALAYAAPAPAEAVSEISKRGGIWPAPPPPPYCCPKGTRSNCYQCQPGQTCSADSHDTYNNCASGIVVVCNLLNNNNVNIPIELNLLS